MSLCEGCGKEVIYAVDEAGKTQILDKVAPVYIESGTGYMRGRGVKRITTAYVSHFATCPQASNFSKTKQPKNESKLAVVPER